MTEGSPRVSLKGYGVSTGVVVGPAHLYTSSRQSMKPLRWNDGTGQQAKAPGPEAEKERLRRAIKLAVQETESLRQQSLVVAGEEEAAIFDAHLLILTDPQLQARITDRLDKGEEAEQAVLEVTEDFARQLETLPESALAQRAADVRDGGGRLLAALGGQPLPAPGEIPEGSIVVAADLAPSQTVRLDPTRVAGIVTAVGGPTSHTAIFARAMGLPAVVGVGQRLLQVGMGDTILLNGDDGEVILHPGPDEIDGVGRRAREARQRNHKRAIPHETRTRDGHRVEVAANIGHPREAEPALKAGAEGIGLLRSESLYLGRAAAPTEEEQYQAYRAVAEIFGGRPVIIRTVDLGGDKSVPYLSFSPEENPFLGWRGLRVCLESPHLFLAHLRAILRAGVCGDLRIMLPMVASPDEVSQAREILKEAKTSLEDEGYPFAPDLPVGVMIETPAAAILADRLAPHSDFFSLGTNDLTQYTLAVDRTNRRVAPSFRPEHPAVLRLIGSTIAAAHQADRWVGVCGEMAGELALLPLLVGLGVDELSVSVPLVERVKERVRGLEAERCRVLAEQATACDSAEEVLRLVRHFESAGRK